MFYPLSMEKQKIADKMQPKQVQDNQAKTSY